MQQYLSRLTEASKDPSLPLHQMLVVHDSVSPLVQRPEAVPWVAERWLPRREAGTTSVPRGLGGEAKEHQEEGVRGLEGGAPGMAGRALRGGEGRQEEHQDEGGRGLEGCGGDGRTRPGRWRGAASSGRRRRADSGGRGATSSGRRRRADLGGSRRHKGQGIREGSFFIDSWSD
jgi:hypothetical protein